MFHVRLLSVTFVSWIPLNVLLFTTLLVTFRSCESISEMPFARLSQAVLLKRRLLLELVRLIPLNVLL